MRERRVKIRHADNASAKHGRRRAASAEESQLVPLTKNEAELIDAKKGRRRFGPLFWIAGVIIAAIAIFAILDRCTDVAIPYYDGSDPTYDFRCDESSFYHEEDDAESEFIVRAITIEPDDADGYDGWKYVLELAAGANANVVQASDLMSPDFYRALSDYNAGTDAKLYLLQRVKLGDEAYSEMTDFYSGDVIGKLLEKGKLAIDAVHGRRNISGYFADVSEYVVGYAVGDDWDPKITAYSQSLKTGTTYEYTGEYFACKSSFTYFEAHLAEVMNDMCSYETHKYNHQTPIGLWNWTDTDQISQTYAFIEDFDGIAIITQSVVVAGGKNDAGTFAAFNLEDSTDPLINMDSSYASYTDEYGSLNPFEAYVKDIVLNANGPVIVAEFPVTSARGISGIDPVSGRDRGGLGDEGQATMVAAMVGDIYRAGGKGFSVPLYDDNEDTTWNTEDISEANGLWVDAQSTAEHMGLIGYQASGSICIDGDDSEWAGIDAVVSSEDGTSLKMAYDDTYVYFDVTIPGFDEASDTVYIPLDVTPLSGATSLTATAVDDADAEKAAEAAEASGDSTAAGSATSTLDFDRDMDFVVRIDGTDNSELLVQQYYDYLYSIAGSELYDVDTAVEKPLRDSTVFDSIYQYTSPLYLGSNGTTMSYFPATSKRTGVLVYGTANPDSSDYSSLTDYCFGTDTVEIRIPWALLNFYDPASSTVLGDFFDGDGARTVDIDGMYAGIIVERSGAQQSYSSGELELPGWTSFAGTRYIKKAYSSLADAYGYISGEE